MGKKRDKRPSDKTKKTDIKKKIKKLLKRDTIIKVVVIFSTLALILASVLPYLLM